MDAAEARAKYKALKRRQLEGSRSKWESNEEGEEMTDVAKLLLTAPLTNGLFP
jgi:hypothetical protein